MNSVDPKKLKTNRRMLVILIVAFFAPVILAWLFSINKDWRPSKTKNHGNLITPAQTLPEFTLQDAQAKTFSRKELTNKWTLIYLSPAQCDATCTQVIYKLRQARLAQGPNVNRVQYVYLINKDMPDSKTLAEHPDMITLSGKTVELDKFSNVLRTAISQQAAVFIIDPYGRLMMSYPTDFQPKGLIKDLELLLKLR